jgi:hypothetical protein
MLAMDKLLDHGYRPHPFKKGVARFCKETALKEAKKLRLLGYWATVVSDVSSNYLFIKEKKNGTI